MVGANSFELRLHDSGTYQYMMDFELTWAGAPHILLLQDSDHDGIPETHVALTIDDYQLSGLESQWSSNFVNLSIWGFPH